jgi:hypothetical protein
MGSARIDLFPDKSILGRSDSRLFLDPVLQFCGLFFAKFGSMTIPGASLRGIGIRGV